VSARFKNQEVQDFSKRKSLVRLLQTQLCVLEFLGCSIGGILMRRKFETLASYSLRIEVSRRDPHLNFADVNEITRVRSIQSYFYIAA
jgi:hypothetical protein